MEFYKIYITTDYAVSAVNFLWDEVHPVQHSKGLFYPDAARAYAVATVMARRLHVNLNLEGKLTEVKGSNGLTIIVTRDHVDGTSPKALERAMDEAERLAPELAYCTDLNSSWKRSPRLEWEIQQEVEAFSSNLLFTPTGVAVI